jgi:hypothetical protein
MIQFVREFSAARVMAGLGSLGGDDSEENWCGKLLWD